jgi:hypothetical protein
MSKTSTSSSSSSGIGFCGLLTVLFIGLKLGHVINWSWWWVLCPMWIGVAFWVSVLLFILVVALVVSASDFGSGGKKTKPKTFEPHAGKTLGL